MSDREFCNCRPFFAHVDDQGVCLEWCHKTYRLAVDFGTGEDWSACVVINVFDGHTSVCHMNLTPDQLHRALWLTKSMSEKSAYEYLRGICGYAPVAGANPPGNGPVVPGEGPGSVRGRADGQTDEAELPASATARIP